MLNRVVLAACATLAAAAWMAPALAAPPTPAKSAARPVEPRPDPRLSSSDAAVRRAARIERMFRIADRNKDNALSRGEYVQWYKIAARRRGPLTWRKHAAQMFRQLDAGQKGRLTLADFSNDPAFRRTRPGWTRSVAKAIAEDDHFGSTPETLPTPSASPSSQ